MGKSGKSAFICVPGVSSCKGNLKVAGEPHGGEYVNSSTTKGKREGHARKGRMKTGGVPVCWCTYEEGGLKKRHGEASLEWTNETKLSIEKSPGAQEGRYRRHENALRNGTMSILKETTLEKGEETREAPGEQVI